MNDAVVADGQEPKAARAERWRGVVDQWRKSGQSRAVFCREQSLHLWQLRYWVRRFTKSAPTAPAEGKDGFVEVTSPPCDGSGVVLRLRTGVEVELRPGFDGATLKRLLDLVMAPC